MCIRDRPKEGTILTVARVIADEVEKVAGQYEDVAALFKTILVSGDAILRRTPELLPVLKQAGVVDSGGMGLMVVYRGMYAALTGEPVEADVVQGKGESSLPGEFVDLSLIHIFSLFNSVFGGSMSSRLFQKIREERGAAYTVYSYPNAYTDAGMLSIYAGTNPDAAVEVCGMLVDEARKIAREGMTEQELSLIHI